MQVVLPDNLELLSLLHPSATRVDNVAVEPPLMVNPVVAGERLEKDELRVYRQVKRERAAMCTRTGSASSFSSGNAGKDSVVAALAGLSDVHNFFVLTWVGLQAEESLLRFEKMVFDLGNDRGGMFSAVTLDEYRTVFRCAWCDLVAPVDDDGKPRRDMGTQRGIERAMGISQTKARRLQPVHRDTTGLLMGLAFDISARLRTATRRAG